MAKEITPAPVRASKTRKTAEEIAETQANHPTMKWYDVFRVKIVKQQVENPLSSRNETIITGWELITKVRSTFIEPAIVYSQESGTNLFARGIDSEGTGSPGEMMFVRDKYKNGDKYSYVQYLEDMGIDPAKDSNYKMAKALGIENQLN